MGPGTVDELTRRLVHVRYAAAAVAESEGTLCDAVATARSAGASWGQIAEVLQLSPATARRRFAHVAG